MRIKTEKRAQKRYTLFNQRKTTFIFLFSHLLGRNIHRICSYLNGKNSRKKIPFIELIVEEILRKPSENVIINNYKKTGNIIQLEKDGIKAGEEQLATVRTRHRSGGRGTAARNTAGLTSFRLVRTNRAKCGNDATSSRTFGSRRAWITRSCPKFCCIVPSRTAFARRRTRRREFSSLAGGARRLTSRRKGTTRACT